VHLTIPTERERLSPFVSWLVARRSLAQERLA
jgi:hypothetical protein